VSIDGMNLGFDETGQLQMPKKRAVLRICIFDNLQTKVSVDCAYGAVASRKAKSVLAHPDNNFNELRMRGRFGRNTSKTISLPFFECKGDVLKALRSRVYGAKLCGFTSWQM
jgi:hypothetical protein